MWMRSIRADADDSRYPFIRRTASTEGQRTALNHIEKGRDKVGGVFLCNRLAIIAKFICLITLCSHFILL